MGISHSVTDTDNSSRIFSVGRVQENEEHSGENGKENVIP